MNNQDFDHYFGRDGVGWFYSSSDPVLSEFDMLSRIENGASLDEFHTTGWDASRNKGLTFRQFVERFGVALEQLPVLRGSLVKAAIRYAHVDIDQLEVDVDGRQIVINGVVPTHYNSKLAQDAAKRVVGEGFIVNRIVVAETTGC